MRRLLFILLIIITGCGIQSQLNQTFTGKDLAYIEQNLKMKVSHIYQIEDGKSKAVFVKKENLRSTTINQGQTSLDPIITPSVEKTEYFTFILDTNGKVITTKYEKEYKK